MDPHSEERVEVSFQRDIDLVCRYFPLLTQLMEQGSFDEVPRFVAGSTSAELFDNAVLGTELLFNRVGVSSPDLWKLGVLHSAKLNFRSRQGVMEVPRINAGRLSSMLNYHVKPRQLGTNFIRKFCGYLETRQRKGDHGFLATGDSLS
ncbi:hypothetical protein LTR46_011977 [Exophiala xenobiotica]|nr:hypothetical protein LTR46_011977 [Exophiala xenobiotica]